MRISKFRQKLRSAQPRVEHFRGIPECAGPDEAVDPPTVVRLQGYRSFPPAVLWRALVANCPAGPVPHLRAGQAAPRRHLIPPPLRPERPDHVQAYGFVQLSGNDGGDAGLLTFVCDHIGECMTIRTGRRTRSADLLNVTRQPVGGPGRGGAPSLGQWARVCKPGLCGSGLEEWESGDCTSSPRQRGRTSASRASAGRQKYWLEGVFLYLAGGEGSDRAVQTDLQPHRALRLTRIQDTVGGDPPGGRSSLCWWHDDHGSELETKSMVEVSNQSIWEGADDGKE